MKNNKTVYVGSDTFLFKVDNVSDKKYNNWLKMKDPKINTTDFTAPGFPFMMHIEPTCYCNLSCDLCPSAVGRQELERPLKHLSFDMFKSLIDDMQEYLMYIILWDWGEPFMNPQLPAMIKYASSKGIKIITSTNGTFLNNQDLMEQALTSGLSVLVVALDSLTTKPYDGYRKGLQPDKVVEGLEKLVYLKKKLKSKTLINLRMVLMKGNEDQLPAIRQLGKRLKVDRFSVKTCNLTHRFSFNDYTKLIPDDPKYRRYVYKEGTYDPVRVDAKCNVVWRMGYIHADGDVVACGYDYTGKYMKAGNISEKPFTQIWNSPEYRKLRKQIYIDKEPEFMCQECFVNFKHTGAGWFPEIQDFNRSYLQQLKSFCKNKILKM